MPLEREESIPLPYAVSGTVAPVAHAVSPWSGAGAGRYRRKPPTAAARLYDPDSDTPFALSRSKAELFMDCARCARYSTRVPEAFNSCAHLVYSASM